MTTVREPQARVSADSLAPGSVAADRVEGVVGPLPPVDLPTLESGAALLTRVDRKYVVALPTLERLIASLGDDWRALEINGRRSFGYRSTYFDTENLLTYRAHLQRRRKRYKVRVRRYLDSDACMLEVKRKGLRGLTVKERRPHPSWRETELGDEGKAFVAAVLLDHGVPISPLQPLVVTSNRRVTLASLDSRSRLTIDFDLVCGWGEAVTKLRSDHVVLESKVEGHASVVDGTLRGPGGTTRRDQQVLRRSRLART